MEGKKEVKEVKTEKKEERISIDPKSAYLLRIQEFDKKISEIESELYVVKREKMTFIYQTTVDNIIAADKLRKMQKEIG